MNLSAGVEAMLMRQSGPPPDEEVRGIMQAMEIF
jgi:hypothetical protein